MQFVLYNRENTTTLSLLTLQINSSLQDRRVYTLLFFLTDLKTEKEASKGMTMYSCYNK